MLITQPHYTPKKQNNMNKTNSVQQIYPHYKNENLNNNINFKGINFQKIIKFFSKSPIQKAESYVKKGDKAIHAYTGAEYYRKAFNHLSENYHKLNLSERNRMVQIGLNRIDIQTQYSYKDAIDSTKTLFHFAKNNSAFAQNKSLLAQLVNKSFNLANLASSENANKTAQEGYTVTKEIATHMIQNKIVSHLKSKDQDLIEICDKKLAAYKIIEE